NSNPVPTFRCPELPAFRAKSERRFSGCSVLNASTQQHAGFILPEVRVVLFLPHRELFGTRYRNSACLHCCDELYGYDEFLQWGMGGHEEIAGCQTLDCRRGSQNERKSGG